jgi:4-diphosphocytidyl-2-C-methyl-D-erythritol kinase
MNELRVVAPAKVNIVLRVLGRRPDGYHDLFMVMEKLSLADEIILEESRSGIELVVEGHSDAGMQSDKNLAFRAAVAFQRATGESRGVKIRLKKIIPIAAGLGGGSSDAAAVLRGLNSLWRKNLPPERLSGIGSKLGGDVPFFCHDGPAIAEGIGDRITTIEKLPNIFFLLINPGFAVSTPWVYEQYDKLTEGLRSGVSGLRSLELTVKGKDVSNGRLFEKFRDVTSKLKNDLERVTIASYPEIGEIKSYLDNHGARGSLMSGSGPTVFGIFEDEKTRDEALIDIPKKNWKAFAAENFRDS